MSNNEIKKFDKPKGHNCFISSGIHDGLTFGTGELDEYGYFEKPCYECAREWEKQYPESGQCWPFSEEYLNKHKENKQ